MSRRYFATVLAFAIVALAARSVEAQQARKPNILVIFGDDVGQSNVSAYSRGLMGFMTPNIDRIGAEGGVFVTYYGQQSCTAGRAAFIMGQSPFRTGLTKVGLPGATGGIQKEDPTIADFLRPLVSSDQPRLRRVLRQPVSPERRGGAGKRGLSQGPGVPEAVRPARSDQVHG
jgi:hypothetical protein